MDILCNFFALLAHLSTLSAYKGTPKWGYIKDIKASIISKSQEQKRASGPGQELNELEAPSQSYGRV